MTGVNEWAPPPQWMFDIGWDHDLKRLLSDPVARCIRDHREPSWNIPCAECTAATLKETR